VTQGPATANQTTRAVTLYDANGFQVLSATEVYIGSGYARIDWTTYENDAFGRALATYRSDGTISEALWGCCGRTYTKDGQGQETDYVYDDLKRLLQRIERGTGSQPDITTTYAYDAAGRRLSETASAGGLSLSSSTVYDVAGRAQQRTDAAQLTTTYAYADGGRTTTVTRPGGATEITERYLDGRLKRVSGTGVVTRYYEYGVNSDGTQWTKIYTGSQESSSPMWTKTTTNMLGQTISEERPGYGAGVTLTTTMHYNDQGQLERAETPGQADTLYSYDSLGNVTASGLDVDANGTLDDGTLSGATDRVSTSNSSYEQDGSGDWWQVSTSGSAGETTTTKTRLTGLGTSGTDGILTAESVSIDIFGQETVSRTYTDRCVNHDRR
jgi:YD repeat-containing protein